MPSLEQLERRQVPIYGAALAAGAVVGATLSGWSESLQLAISPILGLLLYGMFAQIPFFELRQALADRRFIGALLAVNFLAIPALVWVLVRWLPASPPLHLGVYLVLLTPCIDYVIVFTHLGGGDARRILTATPLLFIGQLVLLPAYLWLFLGEQAARLVEIGPFAEAFLTLIVLPLLAALATQAWANRGGIGQRWLSSTAWFPVPLMAATLFVVVASQFGTVREHMSDLGRVIPLYVAFLVLAPLISRVAAWASRLNTEAGRALIFSAGTRNSLVVLLRGKPQQPARA